MSRELVNLVVDLDERFALGPMRGFEIELGAEADDATLAWIDETFGGSWSSEAHAGNNVIARSDGKPVGFATYDAKGFRFSWLRGMATEPGVGVFGPIGVAPAFRRAGLGTAMLHGALAALRASGYRRALIAAVGEPSLVRYYERAAGARVAERFSTLQLIGNRWPRVVVLASGNGSNFQAVADAARDGRLPIDIVALICNKPQAYAIARAADAGIKTDVLTWQRDAETRARYDERLLSTVSAHRPDLVLLLGWMHLLDARFVRAFPNAIVNVHPAFLPLDPAANDVGLPDGTRMPAFRGAHAVADALAAGCRWTGATVHVVTADTDRGPVLTRRPLAVSSDETQGHVLERLHPIEHRLVESAILRWLYER